MSNLIQIKRSNTSATPTTTLNSGELAYSYNSNGLFIGAQTGVGATGIKIGGYKYSYVDQATQGTLTPNSVILVDANAFIGNTYTSGLFVSGSVASPTANATAAFITSITPQANATQLGSSATGSNTELVTSYAIKTYVSGQIGLNGVNTNYAYTFANVITISNNFVVTGQTNTATLYVTTSANIGTSVFANSSGVTTTGYVNAASVNASSVTVGTSVVANTLGVYTTGTVNAASHTVGTSFVANSTTIFQGNTTTNTVIGYNATDVSIAEFATNANNFIEVAVWNANTGNNASADFIVNDTNGPANTNLNYIDLGINGNGFNQSTWTINGPSDGYLYTGNTNLSIGTQGANYLNFFTGNTLSTNERMRITPTGNVGIGNTNPQNLLSVGGTTYLGNATTTNSTLATGNTTVTGFINATSSVNAASLTVGTSVIANTLGVFTTGTVNGATLSVGSAFLANGTATYVGTSSANVTLSSTGVTVANATTTTVANTTGLYVGSQAIINSTSIVYTGGVVNAASANAYFSNMNIAGNLTVSGTVTAIDSITLQVKDNMILLADQQSNTAVFTDAIDAGWAVDTGNTSTTYYSGMARIAAASSNTNPYFKLFSTTVNPNNTVIDTGATTGTLQAFLAPYGSTNTTFLANSTAVALTAGASVSVNITANSVTLGTPLAATSGGTGLNTYAAGDLLYAATSNPSALSKLSVAANGQVLQITNNLPSYGTLDGGTF